MKKYYSIKALVGLPGLPGTVQGVKKKAEREGWQWRPRKARGGGREYAFESLPDETKDHLLGQELGNLPTVEAPVKSLAVQESAPVQAAEDLKGWQREILDARSIIYREFEQLKKAIGSTKAIKKLVAMAETETLPEHMAEALKAANARSKRQVKLSRSTLMRWQQAVKEGGILALAPAASQQEQELPAWVPYFVKCYNTPANPSISEAIEKMAQITPANVDLPTYDQARRFNRNRSAIDRERGRKTGNALKQYKGYVQRDTSDLEPLEVCMCDGHSFKAKVAHFEHGRPFLPEVCAVVDVKTRLVIGWSAGVAESGQTVADALRHAVTVNEQKLYGGIPAIFYTDGGSGNISKLNSHRITGFYARLGITHKTGLPGNAQGRGLVERLNKPLWIRAAKNLPTFTGRDMDESVKRKVYLLLEKSVRMGEQADILPSWGEFLACCAAEVENYNRRPHRSLPRWNDPETGRKRNMAPLEYWALHLHQGWRPATVPEELVNDLFYPQVIKTVQRGAVTIFKNRYSNRDVLDHYHGQRVIVEYDIHNAEAVRVRDLDQRLLCLATFSASRARFFPKEVSKIALENRVKGQQKLLERRMETVNAQLGTTIDTTLAPLQLSAEEQTAAAELLIENKPAPTIEQVFDESLLETHTPRSAEQEFDESLLEIRRPHRQEPEFDETLFAHQTPAPTVQQPEFDDEPQQEEAAPGQPDNLIDARDEFRQAPDEDDDNWQNLDGFERYEYLQRQPSLSREQQKWCEYFETTKDYQILRDLYAAQEEQ